jgi:hypothetical protein
MLHTQEEWRARGRDAVAQRREDLRAADVDRQFVAERLKGALDEGRISLSEYDERLRDAYASKTYGDLDKVLADLPGFVPVEHSQVMPASTTYPTDAVRQEMAGRPLSGVPKWLIGVWSAWLIAVSVNVVIWLLVSVSSSELVYFWPMWVAGPWGAVLLATTVIGLLNPDKQREIERKAEQRERKRRERRR